jgi:hypothetical protein
MLPAHSAKQLDKWMGRILFVKALEKDSHPKKPLFGLALLISASRCTLQYVVFPFILPFFGFIGHTPRWLSLSLSAIAFASLIFSLRNIWQSNHPHRFAYLPLALLMLIILGIFLLSDFKLLHF